MKKLFLFLAVCMGLNACHPKADRDRPNIVLIMADDMGYECLGCNGNTEYKTPNLDHLATEGIRFEHCYAQPLCTPSRVKIMTGKFNYRNYEDFGYLNPSEVTFGNLLKQAGYATCISGKWQLNGLNRNNEDNQDVNRPVHFGFDEYCLWQLNRTRAEGERYADPLITQNGKDLGRDVEKYGPRIFTDHILDFIDRKAEQPFFVYYPMVLVHDPFVPTPDSPEWENPEKRYEKDTAYFADMMSFTDKLVGEIEAKLKEKGIWENTLLIFTGDNGTHPSIFSNTKSGIIQGAKGQTINTGNHVPFILSWPAQANNGIIETVISFADVLPTLCDVAGVSPEIYTSDGSSMVPLITGDKKSIQDNVFIHYTPRWGNRERFHNRWVLNGEYKLYRDGRFYDTGTDPLELNPLVELTDKQKQLKKDFERILDEKEQDIPFAFNDTIFNVKY